ncbi:hypothetical protein [Streptomyces lanatus]|uniref:PE-PGRS family protein n=1 Tax=Streptomyces lanatus TaxID=66900 RepID=A0ABV1XUZ4_9ACTN|nr:hypothetical protein [Streptomyces lanatus]GHH13099.1 hypothetical protein GCM10018780_52390 [Streptomyces lanatus]
MAENDDEAAGAEGSEGAEEQSEQEQPAGAESDAPAGPFVRDFNPMTDGYPRVSPRSAMVQFYRNGGYTVTRATGVQHVDKPMLARAHSICEIALGTYVTPLQMELPAAGGTTFFKAEVDIQWTVTDPHLAALEVVTDVANRLTAPVLERLREVTTTYRVTEAEQANRAITRDCSGGRWADLGSELGLRVRLYVRLRVDDRTIEHADEERDAHAQAKVIRLRQESYRRMLQGGELEQLSFMLAADPEGAKDFLEKIRQEGRQDEKERVARLFAMAARGELATVDVETQVLNLLNQGDGRPMVGPIGTIPARRPSELSAGSGAGFNPDWASDEPPRRPSRRGERARGESGRRGEPYPGDDADYDEPRARRRTYRSDHDDEPPRPRDGRRAHRPELDASGSPGAYPDRDPEPDPDGEPRSRDRREGFGSSGPVPGGEREDGVRSGDRPRTYRPEPYHPDDERERPRRRRRGGDEGWSWAEEDR